jgi:16S rRNA (cytosine1402-N4)-methyltransferase
VDETLRYLAPERGGVFVDCTLGLGGHAEAILEASDEVRVVGIDRDPAALAVARERLAGFGDRVRFAEGRFTGVRDLVAKAMGGGTDEGGEPPKVAGILADLGVSSMQLDTPERGFSFRVDAPLDMRMGRSGPTAADVVNEYGEADLERIFREYGEERQARRIARAIVPAREDQAGAPIDTTARLREVILQSKGIRPGQGGRARKEGRVDPATRVFQALRIEVNGELQQLERFLDEAVELLEEEGRLVVISYHSGEDRIVKNTLRDLARGEIDQVTGRPLAESRVLEVLTKKPVRPTPEEEAENPRARSARLRAALRRTVESS